MNNKFDIEHDSATNYAQDGSKKVLLSRRIFSACMGSFVTSIVVTPLDVVKVRLQTGKSGSTSNLPVLCCDQYVKNGNGLSTYSKCLGLRRDQSGRVLCDQLVYSSKFFDHVEPLSIPKSSVSTITFNTYYQSQPRLYRTSLPSISAVFDKSSILFGLRQIIQQDGITGLWRGLVPTLVMALPATVVYFVGYESLRNHHIWNSNDAQNGLISQMAPMICGASSRTLAVCVISPLELVRTRIQSIGVSGTRFTLWQDISTMIKNNGMASLWKGLIPTLWRDVPFSALYWWGYEKTKNHLQSNTFFGSDNTIVSFASGCISGAFSATVTTPLDVAKTRRQVQGVESAIPAVSDENVFRSKERSTHRILLAVWNEAGWKGLFRGLGARIAKVAPACGIMIASYEVGKRLWGDT